MTLPPCPLEETSGALAPTQPADSGAEKPVAILRKSQAVARFRSFPFQTAENPLLPDTG